jgi:hypothetical protein
MKLASLQAKPQDPAQDTPEAQVDAKVVPIESANSRGSSVDDGGAAYTKAVETAKKTGNWEQVFKMKKIAGFK